MITYLLSVIQWVEHTDRVINNLNESSKLTVDLETGLRGFLITGDEHFLDPYEVAKPRIIGDLRNLQELVADNPQQVDRLKRLESMQVEWNKYAQSMVDLQRQSGDYRGAVKSGRGKSLTDAIRQEYANAVDMEQQFRVARNADVTRTTVVSVTLYLIFVLGLSGFLAYSGRKNLVSLSDSYSANLASQQKIARRLEQQAWLRNGQTELAEQVLGQLSLNVLGRNILHFCAQYMGSAVAALYVREEHGGLKRVATYGFSREQEQREQSIYSDEGIVGQAAQLNRLIRLDDVPVDYFKVSSGLGEGSTRSVMVMPTSDDDRVNGVIELGFLRPLQERDVELLELIAGNIGTSIEAARYRQRLQEVLAETQQLNEELQVQQEELKTANEELEEQSRILKESQAHLETQQAELEQTNEQLAAQTQTLAEQRDAMDRKNVELNRAQIELEDRADELQRSSKYKSEFLANMSHELRTPLNSSLILAKLLAENPQENLSAEQVKFAESIYSAGNDLLNLINDILDISKVEAGKLEVRPENSSVARLVDGLRVMFEPLTADRKLGFQVEVQADSPTMLFTDRQRLEQILKNLLSNAVKFTEQGAVSLSVSRAAEGALPLPCATQGSALRPTSRKASSKRSVRRMARPTAATAGPASGCRSPATWRRCSAATSASPASRARAACLPWCCRSTMWSARSTTRRLNSHAKSSQRLLRSRLWCLRCRLPTHNRSRVLPMIATRHRLPPVVFWWWKTSPILRASCSTSRMSWATTAWSPMARTKATAWPRSSFPTPSCWTCACPTIPG